MTTKRKTPKKANVTQIPKRGLAPEITNDANHQVVYANVVQVLQNLYDFKLTFGQITGTKNGRLQVLGLQSIIVSPQHAKQLAKILVDNVEQYEKHYMPLPLLTQDDLNRILKEQEDAGEMESVEEVIS